MIHNSLLAKRDNSHHHSWRMKDSFRVKYEAAGDGSCEWEEMWTTPVDEADHTMIVTLGGFEAADVVDLAGEPDVAGVADAANSDDANGAIDMFDVEQAEFEAGANWGENSGLVGPVDRDDADVCRLDAVIDSFNVDKGPSFELGAWCVVEAEVTSIDDVGVKEAFGAIMGEEALVVRRGEVSYSLSNHRDEAERQLEMAQASNRWKLDANYLSLEHKTSTKNFPPQPQRTMSGSMTTSSSQCPRPSSWPPTTLPPPSL